MMQCGSTISALVVARICQGLSAAILYSAGMAFLCNAADKDKFGRAMGFITLAITAGTFLGPSLGGILYHVGRERAVFSLAYGVLAVDVVLRYLVVEKKKPHNQSLKTNEGPNYGTMDSNSHEETAAKGPTLLLLKSPRLLTAFFGWFVVGTILSAIDTVLPIFVRSTFAWSSAGAGVIFIALVTPNFGGPFYGRMVDSSKHAGRLMAIAGFTLCFPSFVLLRLVAYDGITAQILLCGLLFTIGFGVAIVGPSLFVEVARSVSELEAKLPGVFGKHGAGAKAYGLYASSYAAGQLLGPLWAGGITSTLGWDVMTCFMGLFCGITAIVMGLFLGGSIFHRSSKMIG
ncbi:MAG: hypothetical protein MMC33_005571 [Icmadophila ericetorum]|nr:hypothetical protein [Icmadophila ericetorum]